jgi:dethiobiotin synthetase
MRIALAGTGTEIGKTHIGCALARHLGKTQRVLALKPIESGGDDDARALSDACGVQTPPLYALGDPVSPHLAARREGRAIEIASVVTWVRQRELEVKSDVTIIETAGGLFSPLGPGQSNATLVTALSPHVLILIAPDRLGVLHDIAATMLAWGSREQPRLVVAMSAPLAADAATTSNAAELAALGICQVAAVFPRASLDAAETESAAARLSLLFTGATVTAATVI